MPDDKDIIEADIESKHRANSDEGWRAPITDGDGPVQHSIYDGAGNEIVVVSGTDKEGTRKQGTGSTAEEAAKDVRDPKQVIGEGFYPPPGH
ncbi:MAG: hypothetical protein ACRD12_05865 [Acidimicrobiales bacterium]